MSSCELSRLVIYPKVLFILGVDVLSLLAESFELCSELIGIAKTWFFRIMYD